GGMETQFADGHAPAVALREEQLRRLDRCRGIGAAASGPEVGFVEDGRQLGVLSAEGIIAGTRLNDGGGGAVQQSDVEIHVFAVRVGFPVAAIFLLLAFDADFGSDHPSRANRRIERNLHLGACPIYRIFRIDNAVSGGWIGYILHNDAILVVVIVALRIVFFLVALDDKLNFVRIFRPRRVLDVNVPRAVDAGARATDRVGGIAGVLEGIVVTRSLSARVDLDSNGRANQQRAGKHERQYWQVSHKWSPVV